MWRPKEGWKNPHQEYLDRIDTTGWSALAKSMAKQETYPKISIFEAGADAAVEELKKRGRHLEAGVMPVFTYPVSGWLVFIPDKEVKDGS